MSQQNGIMVRPRVCDNQKNSERASWVGLNATRSGLVPEDNAWHGCVALHSHGIL